MAYRANRDQAAPNHRGAAAANLKRGKLSTVKRMRKGRRSRRY